MKHTKTSAGACRTIARGYRDVYEASKAAKEVNKLVQPPIACSSDGDASLAGAIPRPLSGARAVPGDRRRATGSAASRSGCSASAPSPAALFAGLFVGQFAHVPVSGMTKSFLFLLFLFGIGYSVGPQFMQALKRDGLGPILLAVVVAITGLTASILVAKVLGLDPGFAAGLMSGALTQSAAMGTATDAINALPLPEADRALLVAHIAVADAVCYIFGYAGVILFCTVIAPALLKIDLRTEALKLEQALGMKRAKPGLASAWRKFDLRAYRLAENSPLVGLTVAAAEARVPEHRLFIQRLRQGERIFEAASDMTLRAGDVIAISGPREVMVELVGPRADEVEDRELLDLPVLAADVLLMSPKVGDRTLADLSAEEWTRGLYLRSVSRGGQELPIAGNLALQRGDLLRLVGPEPVVQKAAATIGTIVAPHPTIRFHRAGPGDLFRRYRRCPADFFGRRHQNFAKHQRGYFARRASGRPFADSLPAVRADS